MGLNEIAGIKERSFLMQDRRRKAGIVMILASRLMEEVAREFNGVVRTPPKAMKDIDGKFKRIPPSEVIGKQALEVVKEADKLVKLIDDNMLRSRDTRNGINDMAYRLTEIFRYASYLPIDKQDKILEELRNEKE